MIHSTLLTLAPTPPFDFVAAVHSHGWSVLAPNSWNEDKAVLSRIEPLPGGAVVRLSISGHGDYSAPTLEIMVEHDVPLTRANRESILQKVSHMLRLDEDYSEFYRACAGKGDPWEKLSHGLGRLLRSPSLFEDIVKTICTTNIQWGGTKRMVQGLVDGFGESFPGDAALKTFPATEKLAGISEKELTANVNLGYRTPYVLELAQRVASGDLDLYGFNDPDLTTDELAKKLQAIKGIGPYATASLLMLLGHYDRIPLDTVYRAFVRERYFKGRNVQDKKLLSVYDKWGRWKGLAYWFEMWLEG